MEQKTFDEYEWAHARRTDPETSHAAAASLKAETLSAQRARVYDYLKQYGPMTDAMLVAGILKMSPSGLRTRRSELVRMGLVEDTGRRERLRSGRKAIVWRALERGVQE
jgi:predicted ArsR family transcriptional regulator